MKICTSLRGRLAQCLESALGCIEHDWSVVGLYGGAKLAFYSPSMDHCCSIAGLSPGTDRLIDDENPTAAMAEVTLSKL